MATTCPLSRFLLFITTPYAPSPTTVLTSNLFCNTRAPLSGSIRSISATSFPIERLCECSSSASSKAWSLGRIPTAAARSNNPASTCSSIGALRSWWRTCSRTPAACANCSASRYSPSLIPLCRHASSDCCTRCSSAPDSRPSRYGFSIFASAVCKAVRALVTRGSSACCSSTYPPFCGEPASVPITLSPNESPPRPPDAIIAALPRC
mmetsp:Transcript_10219/g.33477  ORF Transcript_10219/g.33477 Transcript_10219/m.33477 type:complete len:208 (-) Transcript_10219:886-1509(-)